MHTILKLTKIAENWQTWIVYKIRSGETMLYLTMYSAFEHVFTKRVPYKSGIIIIIYDLSYM